MTECISVEFLFGLRTRLGVGVKANPA